MISELERADQALEAGNPSRALTHLWNAIPARGGVKQETASYLDTLEDLANRVRAADSEAATQVQNILVRVERVRDELERRGLAPTAGAIAEKEAERRAKLEEDAAAAARARRNAIVESRRERDGSATRSFEYSVIDLADDEAEGRINEAGSLGWELVNVLPASADRRRFYFKREVWAQVNPTSGVARAVAPGSVGIGPGAGAAAAGAGGGFFAVGYFESGPDMDMDGDVDGGLLDSLGDLFG